MSVRLVSTPIKSSADIYSPIKTYGHRGTAKNRASHDQHAIIFTGTEPDPLPGEGEFSKESLEMEPINQMEVLDPRSRLHFAKPTPVEHNLRVKHIGDIVHGDILLLFRFYEEENGTQKIKAAAKAAKEAAAKAAKERRESVRADQQYKEEKEYEIRREVVVYEEEAPDDLRHTIRRGSRSGHHVELEPLPSQARHACRSKSRTRPGRSDTLRSSPVPFGSRRVAPSNPRRLTEGDDLPLPDHRAQGYRGY